MLKNSLKILSLTLAIAVVSGCNNTDRNDPKYKLAPKGKYKVTECGLKIELQWKEKNRAYKIEILNEVPKAFKKYSYSYYIDSSITDSSLDNIIFSFHNYCEKKEKMLKMYAKKHLEDIKNFPKYAIVPYIPKVDKDDIPIYSNSESNDNQKKEQVETKYQWLEGDWKGELFVHAMEESFSAELKYNNGKLEIFAKEYCKGEATFSSKQNNDGLSIECKDNYFKLTPVDYQGKIDRIDNNSKFETIYIEYNNKDRFAGWLKKN